MTAWFLFLGQADAHVPWTQGHILDLSMRGTPCCIAAAPDKFHTVQFFEGRGLYAAQPPKWDSFSYGQVLDTDLWDEGPTGEGQMIRLLICDESTAGTSNYWAAVEHPNTKLLLLGFPTDLQGKETLESFLSRVYEGSPLAKSMEHDPKRPLARNT
jgi:hypothetical protein